MKYINQFTSIEDYIKYKKNNKENLPGVNRAIEDNISNDSVKYPNSFVFIDDENNTNYNIIRFKSDTINTKTANYLNTIYDKCIFDNYTYYYVTTIITKNYLYKPLLEIPDDTFFDFNMVNIDLPNTIKKIGNRAFKNTNLESISLNKNIFYVGDRAFEGCTNLKNIEFKNDKEDIILGENILNGCSSLHNITFYNIEAPILDNIGTNTKYLFYDDSTTNFYKTITLPIDYNTDTWFSLLSYDESFSIDKIRHKLTGGTHIIPISSVSFDTGIVKEYENNIEVHTHADTEEININYNYVVQNVKDNLTNKTVSCTIPLQLKTTFDINESFSESVERVINLTYNNCKLTKPIYLTQSARTAITEILFDDDTPSEDVGPGSFSRVADPWEICEDQPFYFENYDGYNDDEPYTGLPLLMFKSTNNGKRGSTSMMTVVISNTSSFTFYILNHGEGYGYDYVMVSKPNVPLTHTDDLNSESILTYDDTPCEDGDLRFTTFTNFKQVYIYGLNPEYSYYISIAYVKDDSGEVSYDCGYVLLPMYKEDVNIYYTNIWGEDYCDNCPDADWDIT